MNARDEVAPNGAVNCMRMFEYRLLMTGGSDEPFASRIARTVVSDPGDVGRRLLSRADGEPRIRVIFNDDRPSETCYRAF